MTTPKNLPDHGLGLLYITARPIAVLKKQMHAEVTLWAARKGPIDTWPPLLLGRWGINTYRIGLNASN